MGALLAAGLALFASLTQAQTLLDVDHPLVGRLWDSATRQAIDEATLRQRIGRSQVLLLGETHDNPEHHRLQQQLLAAQLDAGARPAVVFEQFDVDRQQALDAARQQGTDADALARHGGMAKGWNWDFYRPLVATALASDLPIVAANLSREQLRPVIRGGYAAFDAAELARLQVEAAWSAGRQAYVSKLIEASHCNQISSELRDGLVRSQRLRDAVMADVMLPHLGRGVVAVIGRGHARRDVGVPRYIDIRQPGTAVLTIGFVEVSPEQTNPEAYEADHAEGVAPYDVIWFTPRTERPDPCADFGKRG